MEGSSLSDSSSTRALPLPPPLALQIHPSQGHTDRETHTHRERERRHRRAFHSRPHPLVARGRYGAFSEREAAELLQDLGGAIALLHAQGLCHADLKPENLLLTDAGYVKLVDFGLSAEHAPDATAGASIKPVGTPAYWPPELHNGKERRPTSAGDMWALGVVLYILLTGAHPFDDSFDHVLRRNVLRRGVDWTGWPASAQARSVVESLLRTEPDERLTIEQLLQHPWLREAAPATDTPIDPDMRARETEIERFRRNSARLRAAVFAVMVAQLAADRKEEAEEALAAAEAVERTRRLRERKESNASRSHELRRRNSMRANLLDQVGAPPLRPWPP